VLFLIVAYLGGALTILSPCILPVLPFVFSRADQPFVRSGLPLLIGMALTFAAVATLASVGGGWVLQVNQYGRWIALAFFGIFGLTLLIPRVAERLMRPVVSAGNRLTLLASSKGGKVGTGGCPGIASSILLGAGTGLLWAPCAGPILGVVLTGAALRGASVGTTLLLLGYAAGAATSLALALLIGGRLFARMKQSLGTGEWIRRALGATILGGVAAIATGLDTGVLKRVATLTTTGLEEKLVGWVQPDGPSGANAGGKSEQSTSATKPGNGLFSHIVKLVARATSDAPLRVEGQFPSLSGAVEWVNSPPLTVDQLRGKVVLIDFWTYSCVNCLHTLPYVQAWSKKYRDQGLVVIGVHTPEYAFERDPGNVKRATRDLGVDYPVALDNNYAIWRGFNNQFWPANYFIDAQGRVRYHHFGEGGYAKSERVIQQLLAEANHPNGAETASTESQETFASASVIPLEEKHR
jgi:cytochrome c biogenesis protein CcdA/thiol-disulfide isomerase/thioredoxin